LPEGCTSTAGYSPVTGESCSSTTTTSTGTGLTMTGKEGSITVSTNPTPANGVKVYEGNEKASVFGIKVKATGSDVDVQRVTLRFDNQPYSYFTNVYLYDGDTQVASSALNSSTVSKVNSTDYQITLASFTSKVIVPVNESKVLTVKVDVLPGVSSGLWTTGTTYKDIAIGAPSATAVRAVDQAGLNQYGGNDWTTAYYRTFRVNASQSANATLTVSANANTPKARNVIANSNYEIDAATLLTFDLKATKDDLTIDQIANVLFALGANVPNTSSYTETTGTGTYIVPTTAYLVDDSGATIGTASPDDCTDAAVTNLYCATFSDLNYTIPEGTTKTFSIKVDDTLATPVSHASADDTKKYQVAVNGYKITATKTNGASFTGNAGVANSNDAIVFAEGPEFTLASITTTNTQAPYENSSSTMSATFNIQVKAVTGDVYLSNSSAFTVESSIGGATSTVADVTYVQPSNTVAEGSAYKISEGNTATFAVNATISNGGVAGTYDIRIAGITWGHVSGTLNVLSSYMNGEAAWISPAVYLR